MSKKRIEFHTVANIFPMMTESELTALKNDISVNGLREPIHIFQNKIIDGRNRYIACIETGTKPKFKNFEGTESELLDFVISLNFHRRHLSTSQKACFAAEIMPELEKRTRENLSKKMSAIRSGKKIVEMIPDKNSGETASKLFHVSIRYITDAKKLLNESKELFNEVRQGKLTLQQAKKQLIQSEVLAKLPNLENKNIEQQTLLTDTYDKNTIRLTAKDRLKIQSMIQILNVSEVQAEKYLITEKIKNKANKPADTQRKNEYKEIKVRILQAEKDRLQLLAKKQNISVSALLRDLLAKNI